MLHAPDNTAPPKDSIKCVQHGENEWAIEVFPDLAYKFNQDEMKRVIVYSFTPIQSHPTPVFRYMDEKYVDDFLQNGSLRLSSFKAFSKHSDEKFRDMDEGTNTLCATGDNSTIYTLSKHGGACLILSTSYLGPWSDIPTYKNRSCFEIVNPWGFATAIADTLPDCVVSVLGTCSYVPSRTITKHIPGHDFIKTLNVGGYEAVIRDTETLLQYSPMFRKPTKYQIEQEFRIIWQINNEASEFRDVISPVAAKFCRKADPSEYYY